MTEAERTGELRELVTERGEQLLGRLTRDLLESPVLGTALGRLTRRVRSLSDQLGAIEDTLSRIEGAVRRQGDQIGQRLDLLERELGAVTRALADLEAARPEEPVAVSRDQERLLRATNVG